MVLKLLVQLVVLTSSSMILRPVDAFAPTSPALSLMHSTSSSSSSSPLVVLSGKKNKRKGGGGGGYSGDKSKKILDNIHLSFYPGAKIGIVGLNGSGKSTLLKIMAGVDEEYDGLARPLPGASIGYLSQEPVLEHATVQENIDEAMKSSQIILDQYNEKSMKLADPDITDIVLENHDMLLLDEPTNHLDAESIQWLETYLDKFQGTVVCITHDRYFLNNCAGWILELDRGKGYPHEGNYETFLETKTKRLEEEKKSDTAAGKAVSNELEWIRTNPKAQGTKSKARLKRYDELLLAAAPTELRNNGQIYIPPGPRLGNVVVDVVNLKKSFGDRLLIDDLSFSLPPAGIVGVVGPNGAGKSTLINMIIGKEEPDSGSIILGDTVKIVSVGQERMDELNSEKTVGNLSGGERNRVQLAKLLKAGGNMIILDEPSNDLDVEVLRSLEEALLNFAGSALVVSHDRYMLNRLCTHILACEGDSKWTFFPGNYAEYEANRKERLGESSIKRITYAPLANA
ncbi:P-loop containing nucleoside triphosphate hydrolase protein [Fragilariopsis cylindrus CCMP1102]|uniref:p-loop containing nucleoside triphosphate hydrolase protein n=1 Tax=Fragilariopsis cylindrus CCMP1102 TaxID=635003 RepID=A0A1E7EY15_9STRA|nr:P-loop containing nucleoside triphosphate hydrolase protein [Fragilariopsis cylindrus CCMP1102]|eukprot:OEU10695.1 P-loop containing nucleoside triphosphate hydrolase protein [Fragilariopsis cylindrus CCMP1102]